VSVFLLIFSAVVFFAPEMGGYFLEYNNFLPADSLKTPPHIAPTWYFTPFYSVLRATTADFMWVVMAGVAAYVVFIWLKSRLSFKTKIAITGDRLVADHRHAAAGAGREVLGRGAVRLVGGDPGLPAVAGPLAGQVDPLPSGLAQVCVRRVLHRLRGAGLPRHPAADPGLHAVSPRSARCCTFSFFLLMPWWSAMGRSSRSRPRVTFHPH
jgi:ubiquinol-cytochrome c reductase cytochrome b subunit